MFLLEYSLEVKIEEKKRLDVTLKVRSKDGTFAFDKPESKSPSKVQAQNPKREMGFVLQAVSKILRPFSE